MKKQRIKGLPALGRNNPIIHIVVEHWRGEGMSKMMNTMLYPLPSSWGTTEASNLETVLARGGP